MPAPHPLSDDISALYDFAFDLSAVPLGPQEDTTMDAILLVAKLSPGICYDPLAGAEGLARLTLKGWPSACREIVTSGGIPLLWRAAFDSTDPNVRLFARIAIAGIAAYSNPKTPDELACALASLLALVEGPVDTLTQDEVLKTLNTIFPTEDRFTLLLAEFFLSLPRRALLRFLNDSSTPISALKGSAILLYNIIITQNVHARVSALELGNWVQVLLPLFGHTNTDVQSTAVKAFDFMISSQEIDRTNLFVSSLLKKFSPTHWVCAFMSLLEHRDLNTRCVAAKTLYITATCSDRPYTRREYLQMMTAQQGFSRFLTILSQPTPPENQLHEHVIALLRSLPYDDATPRQIVDCGGVDLLLGLLNPAVTPNIQQVAAQMLAHISKYTEPCKIIMTIGRGQLNSLLKIVKEHPEDKVAINIKQNIEVVLKNITSEIIATPSIWLSEGLKAISGSSAGSHPGPGGH